MIESCITFLPVSNLEKTVLFYIEVVGLAVWKDMGSCVMTGIKEFRRICLRTTVARLSPLDSAVST